MISSAPERPDAILLDAGNTLVFADRVRMARIYRSAGVPWDDERFVEAELAARRELSRNIGEEHVGTEPHLWREYFLTLFRRSGVPETLLDPVGEALRTAHDRAHLWTHVEEGTAQALDRLREAGFRLGVISNADGRMEDALVRAGLRDRVEFVIDSEAVGMEKPDPRIFEAGAQRLETPVERCMYVGDLYPVDVVGAWTAGMSAVLLDPAAHHDVPVDRIAAVRDLPEYLAHFSG